MNDTSLQVINVPIEDVIPNRFQPRLSFDDEALKELAASIKEHGIIQPLILRRLQDKYEIIAGERRYKAAKLAGLTTVPGIVSEMDDKKSAEVAIVENIQRKDLSSIEEAKSYEAILSKNYLTQEELAKKMGLSQSAISNKLRLLTLSDIVQNALMENKISERHARSLLQLDSPEEQNKWLNVILNERLTVKELDRRIKEEKDRETKIMEEDTKDEVPIISVKPDINAIKENATDIIPTISNPVQEEMTKVHEDIIAPQEEVIFPTKKDNKMPNKFFNFLEDESVNMSIEQPSSPVELPTSNDVREEVNDSLEEIEMLDVPIMVDEKDSNNNKEILNSIEECLKNKNIKYDIKEEDNGLEIKYIITISK